MMLRRAGFVLLALTLLVLLWRVRTIGLILTGLTLAALAARRVRRRTEEPIEIPEFVAEAPEPPAPSPPARLVAAMNIARAELGQEPREDVEDVDFRTPLGHARLRVGYKDETPFIALRNSYGVDAELAFIIRRRNSCLGLPPVVDNTPVETAHFEYRLRRMTLGDDLDRAFEAATSRPRLFGELLDLGLREDLQDALLDARHRLEDLAYGGDSLTLVVQPAADPADRPFVHDALGYVAPLTVRVHHFLETAHIPNAQG